MSKHPSADVLLGFSLSDACELLRSVGVTGDSEQVVLEVFTRCVWNTIVEPGDSELGELIANEGAVAALQRFISRELSEDMADADARWRARFVPAQVGQAIRSAAAVGATLLTPESSQWPAGLDDLGLHKPLLLWCRGDVAALEKLNKSVSVVGARASTGYGEHVTYDLVSGLVDRGFTIVSGAAYGIDGVAHRTALASGGNTIALMAGGIDRFYPSGHDTLLRNIEHNGAILAELPCGSAPTRWRFLQRNRLIAAITPITVVVEAGWRSGSLNTAHHAATLGRVLAAVPGPVTSPSSAGCHRIMREADAICVTSADDIAQLVASDDAQEPDLLELLLPTQRRLIEALSKRSSRQVSELEQRTGMSAQQIRALLAQLEVEGVVRNPGSGWLLAKG